jgi:hypothetical protein
MRRVDKSKSLEHVNEIKVPTGKELVDIYKRG